MMTLKAKILLSIVIGVFVGLVVGAFGAFVGLPPEATGGVIGPLVAGAIAFAFFR